MAQKKFVDRISSPKKIVLKKAQPKSIDFCKTMSTLEPVRKKSPSFPAPQKKLVVPPKIFQQPVQVLSQAKRKTPVLKKQPLKKPPIKSFMPVRTERAIVSQRSLASSRSGYDSKSSRNMAMNESQLNSKYMKENITLESVCEPNTRNLTIVPLKDIDMNINVSLPQQPQSADSNLLEEMVSPFDINRDLDSSNYNSNPNPDEKTQPLENKVFDVIYERNSEFSQTHSMSIRTLNSPAKFSPIKLEPLSFKGRIFEFNEEDTPEPEKCVSEKPMETPKTQTIFSEK